MQNLLQHDLIKDLIVIRNLTYMDMKRKSIIPLFINIGCILPGSLSIDTIQNEVNEPSKPNIILIMADDLGWGDVGFNGNKIIRTPNLDNMAADGIIFSRFYSGSPLSSPTRGSCITGRNNCRYGIYKPNEGSLPKEEITLSEVLKENGYTTGHFGKWHLGTLSDSIPDGRRGGSNIEIYSPPWDHGFDVCFSNEQSVPTWDPMKNQYFETPTRYWTGYRKYETENLDGDDSRVIMDRVIPFIQRAGENNEPFFALVWFHTPHGPVVAGPKYKELYKAFAENKQHYYGCITAMDEQIGRLYKELKKMGIDKNTLISFISDNGPAGGGINRTGRERSIGGRNQGVTGGFRDRKGSLYEGGVRVPCFFIWPDNIPKGAKTDFPAVTSDYFPTILNLLGIEIPKRPYDGIDIMPALQGEIITRPGFIGFQSSIVFETTIDASLVSQQYKLLVKNASTIEEYEGGKRPETAPEKVFELFDLLNDQHESMDLSAKRPGIVNKMYVILNEWILSCQDSNKGCDY